MLKRYFTQNNLIYLLLILATGIFLRVFQIGSNYYFTGELGKELLYMRQFVISHSLPLIGMATSHEWLNYGPLYYWIMIPIFNLFDGNPLILFWSALVVAVVGLILNYLVFKKIAGEKVAILSTLIQSISPLLIWITRLSKLHTFFFILMPVFTYLLYLMWQGKIKWVFWTGLTFGILFSFHFSQIPILGVVILLFWIKRDVYKIVDWIKFGIGVLLPNITFLWQDKNIILWLPYRILNVAEKNPLGTSQSLLEYIGKNMFWDQRLWTIGLVVFAILFVHYLYNNRNNLSKNFLPFYLVMSISIMLIANILHGAPPIHYFLPIFTFVPVLFAIYLTKFRFWPLIIIPVLLINLVSFNKDIQFYGNATKFEPVIDFVPFSKQMAMTEFIVRDAKNKPLSINRIGPFDYFPDQYSQNYKYLIFWQRGNFIEGSKNIYSIIEDVKKGEIYVQK